jgi:hypothetical protein
MKTSEQLYPIILPYKVGSSINRTAPATPITQLSTVSRQEVKRIYERRKNYKPLKKIAKEEALKMILEVMEDEFKPVEYYQNLLGYVEKGTIRKHLRCLANKGEIETARSNIKGKLNYRKKQQ